MRLVLMLLLLATTTAITGATQCKNSLAQLCGPSNSEAQCTVCVGRYQSVLHKPNCTDSTISGFCADKTNRLRCGVASSVFSGCPSCLRSASETGALGFWWNWGQDMELDVAPLSKDIQEEAQQQWYHREEELPATASQ